MNDFFDTTVMELLIDKNHVMLFVGITAFLYLLRAIPQAQGFLFGGKWRGLIPVLNLILSAVGIFALNMTSATSTGLKCVLVLIITALSTYGYELTKPIFKKFFKTIFGEEPNLDNGNVVTPPEIPTKPSS